MPAHNDILAAQLRDPAPAPAWWKRRWPSVIGLTAATATLAAMTPIPDRVRIGISAWCVLLAAVVYLTWGVARGALTDSESLGAQTAAVLGFGALAVTAAAADGHTARWILAAGWLSHAAWDAYHHRRDRVVPRWYAEACLAADLLVAAALITAA